MWPVDQQGRSFRSVKTYFLENQVRIFNDWLIDYFNSNMSFSNIDRKNKIVDVEFVWSPNWYLTLTHSNLFL